MRAITLIAAGLCAAGAARAETPSAYTVAAQARVLAASPFADTRDFEFAARGFIATRADPIIRAADGRPVWDCRRSIS